MRIIIIAAGVTALMATAAYAGDNTAYITQVHNNNSASVYQKGSLNIAGVQAPGLQHQSIYQNGGDHIAEIDQVGDGNTVGRSLSGLDVSPHNAAAAAVGVTIGSAETGGVSGQYAGTGNSLTSNQLGNNNKMNYNQLGSNNSLTYNAVGNTNLAALRQTGNSNVGVGSQNGNGNFGAIIQGSFSDPSNGNDAGFHQTGNGNFAHINQQD